MEPGFPVLYELELVLQSDGVVLDRRSESFGFREFWCEGPQFMLNGIPVNLRGTPGIFRVRPSRQTTISGAGTGCAGRRALTAYGCMRSRIRPIICGLPMRRGC